MTPNDLRVRPVAVADIAPLRSFRCSSGAPWEDLVQQQVRGPLPHRYLTSPRRFDGRMLVVTDPCDTIVAVGAHHIEPTMVPDVGYTEVVAVSLDSQGTRVALPSGSEISIGAFVLFTIFRQMRDLGRHPRTFARIDRHNLRSLALCDRVGLVEERPDTLDDGLVQRWGELPR